MTHKHLSINMCLLLTTAVCVAGQTPTSQPWSFAVSGDSRNCGDVIMPAIATDAIKHNVAFYWHLGDLRKMSGPDQDFVEERTQQGKATNLRDYEKHAWDDFVANQIKPWGDTPFFLGIGNHETTPPKTRSQFIAKFRSYLNRPELKSQRLKDDPTATQPTTYYHWMRDGVDFIYLDNATQDQFGPEQMKWVEGVLNRDSKDESIHTIVVGMHEALPESISANHGMNEYPSGVETGRRVYQMLLKAQNESHKTVYVLASHSHFFMEGIFNTAYWKANGGELPGWIVGTAGAERYPLPPAAGDAKAAKTNVYGYLMATVNPEGEPPGTIKFKFEELKEDDLPSNVVQRFTKTFVHDCFEGNRRTGPIQ
jgi:Calcineurin-like phosphoesterase